MTSNRLRWRSIVALMAALLIGVAGCSDDPGSSSTGGGDGEGGEGEDSSSYLMVPAGGLEVEGEVTGDVELEVFLYDRDDGEPVENAQVDFEVVDADDDDTAPSLSSAGVYSGPSGDAAVDLYFGNEEGAWTVRADHPSSNDVEFDVIAGPAEAGQIEVSLINPSASIMDLSDIDVRIYRETLFDCQHFQPLGPQNDDAALADEFVPFLGSDVTFENLSTNQRYVVTAIARGEEGQRAAGACVGSLVVDHEETTSAELILQLVPLNPTGVYDVVSHWDFTEALEDSGPAGSIIVRVLNIFENPGEAIYDEIINLVGNLVGGIISGAFDTFLSITGLDQTFQNMINDFIEGNDDLKQVRDAGRDLRDVVANLEVHSELSIGQLAKDFEFRGQDNWLGITMYWTWGCEPSDGPDCGAIELTADDDGEFAELGVLSSSWTGRVVAYDQLQIDQHAVSLRYGRLIMYVLNDVLLPGVTDGNANSMSEAFSYWFGCDSLANTLIPNGEIEAAGFVLEASTVESFCENAVQSVFGFADILINNLEFDMGLRLGGEGHLIEETSDGIIDRIDDGVFSGSIVETDDGNETATTSSFDAIWDAERQSN